MQLIGTCRSLLRFPRLSFTRWGAYAAAALLAVAYGQSAQAVTRYVNAALASGANDGTSWENAHQGIGGLAIALTAAVNGDQIWVAAGTYEPTPTATRTISFNLKTGVAIYGGFAGDEATLIERDFNANITTLTGDLLGNDGPIGSFTNNADNSHHVVNGNSATATAILDGFTISGGNANGATAQNFDKGGGIIFLSASNATIRNCRVIGNRCTFGGGAGYINSSSPNFSDTIFQTNQGGSFGGAFDMATNCNPQFNRCSFISNTAARAGGVEVFGNSQPIITNCVFRLNSATGSGGGGALWVGASSIATVRNCTIVNNSATVTGGGVLTTGATTNIRNSIIWSNTGPGGATAGQQLTGTTFAAQYCDVQGGFAGTGNINANPIFVNQAGGDLHLASGSPCIDAGNNSLVGAGVIIDRDGNPRFVDDPATTDTGAGTPPIVDMGAYELQFAGPPAPANNACANAIISLAGATNFTTLGATTDGPDEPLGCTFNGNTQVANDVWYLYPAQCTGTATISLCGATYNAKLAVYGGSCPSASGQTIACNDDFCGTSPEISFPVINGNAYTIRIGGINNETGTGTMVITCAVPPSCPSDIDNSGEVNVDDLLSVIGAWGACADPNNCPADIDNNDAVNVDDLLAVIGAWGPCD